MGNKENSEELNSSPPRVRIAPSPTGNLHIGTARTALLNYIFAKKHQGKFILRIEDTDKERSRKEYERDIIENLKWLGLDWDEGPYRQSERKEIYRHYIEKLLDSGKAFECYHTKEELEQEKQEQMKKGEAPRHICSNNPLSQEEIERRREKGEGVIRLAASNKQIRFNDIIRGELSFYGNLLGDISIARDKETPLYNLGVVIDDYEMEITHIIRGEEHISNTPKQILLQEALGFYRPYYAHLPLILGSDKSKLSKRHGNFSLNEYRDAGYLKEALINFMVLLGWNPGTDEEIFSLQEIIEQFSLERVQKSGAVFDLQKLDWINGYYIRKMDLEELAKECVPYLVKDDLIQPMFETEEKVPNLTGYFGRDISAKFIIPERNEKIDFECIKKVVYLFQERIRKLSEISELSSFFFKDKINYEVDLLLWKDTSAREIQENLSNCYKILDGVGEWKLENIKQVLLREAEKYKDRGRTLWPFRVALTGEKASPPPFEIAEILGKKTTLKRVEEAIRKLKEEQSGT